MTKKEDLLTKRKLLKQRLAEKEKEKQQIETEIKRIKQQIKNTEDEI